MTKSAHMAKVWRLVHDHRYQTASWPARVLYIVVIALLTMTMNSTSGSSSIFKDGKLKPGIYKIQNILSETYLDIEVHSREVCCRPAKDLGEGRGIVS